MKSGWFKHAIGAGVTIACLLVIVRQVDVGEVLRAASDFQWTYLLPGIASLAAGYALRIARWSMLLRATGAAATFRNCSVPFLGSIALNNVFPLRMGDVVRALVFPMSMGITRTVATASLVMERLIDLTTLLACFAVGFLAVQKLEVPQPIRQSAVYLSIFTATALVCGLLFSADLGRFFFAKVGESANAGDPRLVRVYSTIGGLLTGFGTMARPRVLAGAVVLSLMVWVGEAGLFYFMLLGFGMEATATMALLVMAVATLSTLAPSSPGYIGPFHLAAFMAISSMGGTSAQAGSYAVLVHLALWLPTTLAGAIAIASSPNLFRAAKEQRAAGN